MIMIVQMKILKKLFNVGQLFEYVNRELLSYFYEKWKLNQLVKVILGLVQVEIESSTDFHWF